MSIYGRKEKLSDVSVFLTETVVGTETALIVMLCISKVYPGDKFVTVM